MALRVPDAASVGTNPFRAAPVQSPGVVQYQDARPGQMQQLGEAMGRFGGVAAQVDHALQVEIDDARSDKAKARYAEAQHNAIHGPKGYRSLVGEQATGEARQKAIDDLRRMREQIAEELDNDEQRDRFEDAADVFDLRAMGAIDGHYGDQVRNQAIGGKSAYIESIIQQQVGTSQDPQASQVNRKVLEAESMALSRLHGEGPEEAKLRLLGNMTKMHGLVIEDLVANGRVGEADAYLKAHQGEIEAGVRTRLLEGVRSEQQRGAAASARSAIADQSTRLALAIPGEMVSEARAQRGALNQNDPIEDPRRSPTYLLDATAKLDQMFAAGNISAEVRDATVARLEADAKAFQQQYASETDAIMGSAEKWLVDNPNEPVGAMPPRLYVEIERRGKLDALNGFAQGRRYVTDPRALAEFDQRTDAQLRNVSKAEVRAELRGLLDDADLNYALARHAKATGTAGENDLRILSIDDRLNEYLRKAGALPRTGGGADEAKSEAVYNLKRNVVERLRVFETTRKRAASDDELQQLFDDAMLDKVYVSDWGSDSHVMVGTLSPEQQESAYVRVGSEEIRLASVPQEIRKEMQRRVMARGSRALQEIDLVKNWVDLGRPRTLKELQK